VLVTGFPAEAFGTNCYVVAAGPGEQCLVVDPGIGVLDRLDEVLAQHRLHPAAVLLTHGHLDHTFSVAPVCGARGITAYVHPADREMLADPAKGLSVDLTALFGGRLPVHRARGRRGADRRCDAEPRRAGDHRRPRTGPYRRVGALPAARRGLDLGCGAALPSPVTCSSPARSGRTDLPGGSTGTMMTSLRDKVLPLADDTVVLPGHGPETTIGRERMANPYLRDLTAAPGRGL
jgi:glyoxylase-like metal-dependent hydrolase (beta-lactamase superfamily II)